MTPAIVTYLLTALQYIPTILAAGQSVEAFIAGIKADVAGFQATGGVPTAAQWAALDTTEEAAYTALMAT